jgi:autotransporter-associated beta strand protein
MILSGSSGFTGPLSVTAGILEVTGSITQSSSVTISTGATLHLAGGTLDVNGAISSNGLVKLSGSASLALTGTFTNTGVLDLINGPQSLPANLVNNGIVLDSRSVRVQQVNRAAGIFSMTIQGYAQHIYQLQHCASLVPPVAWTNTGVPQTGYGFPLTFSDSAAGGTQGFYRVQVSP